MLEGAGVFTVLGALGDDVANVVWAACSEDVGELLRSFLSDV